MLSSIALTEISTQKTMHSTMDTIPVISTVHHGSYRDMEYAYNALEDYINEHDLEVIGSPMESYVFAYNDPKRKYLSTTLYYPIAKY